MEVPQAYRRKISLLEKAVKLFWLRFFQERSDFRAFALTQTDHFPPSFIDRLIERLNRMRWPRPLDSGYEIPMKIVARLVALFADPDPDQFICSIYDLEKRVKKRADRERKKLLAIAMEVPQAYRRKISLLEDAVELFWDRFFPERSFFRAFALTQTYHFPPSFIDRLIEGLNRMRWTRHLDPGYEIPRKIVARLVALFADLDPDQFICSIYDLEKRVKKRADRERKKLLAIAMEVPQAYRRETSLLEDAVELFWDRFFLERSFFRAFALTQTDLFPPSFIDRLIEGLYRVRWTRHLDPGYKIPRKIMARLVALFADPDQFICSIYDLEKRVKKKADKKRKKLSAIPPWDLSVIEKSIHQFWVTFSSLDGADLRSFAESQANNFPHNYIAEFLDRLKRAGWSQLSDSDHKLPLKLMSRLASSMCKAPEMVDDCFSLVMRMEAEMEAEVRRAEAEKIALEAQLRRQEGDAAAAAEAARKKAEMAEKSAQAKERKRILREKNNLNRIGAKALGLL